LTGLGPTTRILRAKGGGKTQCVGKFGLFPGRGNLEVKRAFDGPGDIKVGPKGRWGAKKGKLLENSCTKSKESAAWKKAPGKGKPPKKSQATW